MELTKTLEEFNKLNQALVQALDKGNSSLANSHEVSYFTGTTKTTISILANEYWYWINNGRGPSQKGNKPPVVRPSIKEWLEQKNIPEWYQKKKDGSQGKKLTRDEQAFLIARKIHREGFEGNFYVDDTLPNFETKIEESINEDLNNYFNNEFDN
jgi:hypothetical protein